MPDLFCDWNQDFILTPNGSIQTAVGWDRVRQRIIRSLITNAASQLPDGSTTAPDYIFHPQYGIGAGSLVGQNPTKAYESDVIARVNKAVLADSAVDPGTMPTIIFQTPRPGTWIIYISVKLRDGTVGKVAVEHS